MRWTLAILSLAALVLAGCTGPGHIATTQFASPGAFRAALAAGAEAPGPDLRRGETVIAITAPDLDEAWVAGQYALTGVQWTPSVKSGPTVMNPEQQWEQLIFHLVGTDLSVQYGYSPKEIIRTPAHHFLQNVTTLGAAEREAVVQQLMDHDVPAGNYGEIRNIGLPPEAVDASSAWRWSGGLKAMRGPVHDGYHEAGAWYKDSPGAAWRFKFTQGFAVLEDDSLFGDDASATVTLDDRVHFSWTTDQPATDARADGALRRLFAGTSIEVPPADELEWGHEPAEH